MNEARPNRAEESRERAGPVEPPQMEQPDLHDRLLRALAEVENTRRRGERAVADACQFAISDFARDLLAVVDALKRALAAAQTQPRGEGTDSLLDGIEATRRVLMAVLASHGVKPIEAEGTPFDPKLHEAVLEVNSDTREPGTVLEVAEDGYTINGRLLRPARVVVVRRSARTPESRSPEKEASGA